MQIQVLSAEFSPVFSAPFAEIVEKSTSTRCHVCSESESLPKHSNSNHGGGRVGRRLHTSISPVFMPNMHRRFHYSVATVNNRLAVAFVKEEPPFWQTHERHVSVTMMYQMSGRPISFIPLFLHNYKTLFFHYLHFLKLCISLAWLLIFSPPRPSELIFSQLPHRLASRAANILLTASSAARLYRFTLRM